MSEIENGTLRLYGTEHSKCNHLMTIGFKRLIANGYCDSVIVNYNIIVLYWTRVFIRPPDIVVDRIRFGYDSICFIYLLFSSATLRPHWTKLNQNRLHVRKWMRCAIWKCSSKIWGIPSPKSRGPKHLLWRFRRLRNLNANLTAYIFGMKHDIGNRARSLSHATPSENFMNCGPQTA